MSQTWQAPFRVLREQFLVASRENFRINLALASFPGHDSYRVWYDRTIQAELVREATNFMNQEPGQRTKESAIGTVWGEAEGVRRFDLLAKEAGNALPFDFYPANRLFPWINELSNVDPNPVTLWSEFLFVTRITAFRVHEDHPTRGCRIARFEGDPFLASATAIEQFLLTPTAPNLDEYFQRMRAACPWLVNRAGGFPMTPPGVLDSPFLRFDLVRAFQSAIELGAALAARDALDAAREPDGADGAARFMASLDAGRVVEVAGERLLCVLNRRMSSVREWSRQLDLADASPGAREALLTLGLALSDIRGDWEVRGRELLAGAAWHLWSGMSAEDRAGVRELLAETHRLWGWPMEAQGEPGEYTGPRATLSDPRVIDQGRWRTMRADYLNQVQAAASRLNILVDTILLPNGRYFDVYRDDIKGTRYSLPSVCPHAEPKLPLELRPEGDILADLECRFRDLGLIGPDESIHWVGRQDRRETRCGCELAPAGFFQPRPAEWRTLRDLRAALVALLKTVDPYVEGRWAGSVFPAQNRGLFDLVAERVCGLAQSLNLPLPPAAANPSAAGLQLHGPTALPVHERAEGVVVFETGGRQWLSNWRAVRVAVDARLEQLDRAAQPDTDPEGIDTRSVPLDAPAGTPSSLREAFESVARALFDAAVFRREPSSGAVMFRELGMDLSGRIRAAHQRYTDAELQLQAVAEASGCAHQEALTAVRAVNDAIGHVLLGTVPDHMAVAHVRRVPAPDVTALLRRMRQQVSRAAHAARTASAAGTAGAPTDNGRAAGGSRPADSPPIDETELAVLRALRDKHPLLTKNVDIEAAADLSKQTVGEVVTALIDKGLATRPQGERKGVVLTAEGLALVDRIRKSSTDHP